VTCPRCPHPAPFHSHRSRTFVGLLGPVTVRRAYYRCGRCGRGRSPFDESAGLSGRGLTLAAEEVVSLTGLLTDSFAEAAEKVLPRLAGLHLGESTVERATQDVGGVLGDWLDQGGTVGDKTCWAWRRDAHGRRVAYVSLDATGVPQQGPGGAATEGRMPWVAMVYNPPAHDAGPAAGDATAGRSAKDKAASRMQARYLAGLYTLPLLGLLLRKQAQQVGMEEADLWVGLSDAGNGLEDFVRKNFNRPDLVVILDFYHPAGRLEELAKCWHEGDQEKAQERAGHWCGVLKRQGGAKLLEQLRALPPPGRKAARAKYQETLGYLDNHKHRMDYPEYQRQGWYIGSGPVESACKTVVGQRLKLAGMRWGEEGTDHVCHLRALFKSDKGQWEAFWARRMNKGSIFYQPN
jgi:hypothetical protein